MTKRFLDFIPWLLDWEGRVFENDPDDPGNYVNGKLSGTKYGIDARSHPNLNIAELTEEEAIEIYWHDYWLPIKCDNAPKGYGEVAFNCHVNCGKGRLVKIEQKIGIPRTASKFLDEQEAFYRRLADARPKSRKYLKGWLNRTRSLRKKIGA